MNKCIYISSFIETKTISIYFNHNFDNFPHQSQKFNRLLIEGFRENKLEVVSISIPPVNRTVNKSFYFKKIIFNKHGINFINIFIINFPIFKQFNIFFGVLFSLIKQSKTTKLNSFIVVDMLNISALFAVKIYSFFSRLPVIGILTDLPGFNVNSKIQKVQIRKIYKIIYKKFALLIVLTSHMKDLLRHFNKNILIIEGISDTNLNLNLNNNLKQNFTCLYSGTLAEIYGIKNLVEAFKDKSLSNINLLIYGNGSYKKKIEEECLLYNNIKYLGSLNNDEVVRIQKTVHLLINPRPISNLFTKYSFPSKIMEYMSSGVPTVTTKLEGIPDEYKDYLYFFKDDTKSSIINFVYNFYTSNSFLDNSIGLKALRFVNNKKNKIVQTKKILTNLNQLIISKNIKIKA
jgi:glycosyltransferase involved in cell wall biosynthesis